MSVNKHKKIETILNDTSSFCHRRSSLKVNLSCVPNLSDSGNDSLEQIDFSHDEDSILSYGIPFKNVNIVLERISKNNVQNILSKSKNKQIFNKEDELCINTSTIYTKNKHPSKFIIDDDKCESIKKNELFSKISITSKIKCQNEKNNLNQNICNTPKNKYKRKDIKKTIQSNKKQFSNVKKKFVINTIDNSISSKCYSIKQHSIQQLEKESHNKYDVLKLKKNKIFCDSNEKKNHKPDNCINYENNSLILNISESENDFIPIACSTMINDKLLDIEKEEHSKNAHNLQKQCDNYACQLSCENFKVIGNNKNINLVETDELNTMQTSLNVNTSIDQINDNNKYKNKSKQKDCENKKSFENEQKDTHALNFKTTQDSVNTVCTSLQMNTSLDTSKRLQKNNDTIDDINLIKKQKSTFNLQNTKNNSFDVQKTNNYEIPYRNDAILQKIHNCGNINNTIILHNSSCKMSHIDSKTSIIIKESIDESKIETNQNMKYSMTSNNKKKCKKKLLPLHESSQLLSFSPVQNEEYSSPPFLIFRKKHKKNKNEVKKIVNENNTEIVKKKKKNYDGKKKQKKTKKIVSKKIVIKKIVNEDILKKLKENKEKVNKLETTHIYTLERNLSDDFQPTKTSSVVQFTKKKQMHKLNIVTTGLSNEDKDIVRSVVKTLGSAKIELKVTKNTTHIVTTGVRTINLLHGIIRGCWLVSFEWILKSLENNAWLNPEKYEMTHFSKAVLENRKDRQLFGKSYVPELFTACGCIYIEKNTTPPYNVLKDLIKAAGGCITENPETAKIIIGVEGLKETWILDCITSGELQPHNQYQQL